MAVSGYEVKASCFTDIISGVKTEYIVLGTLKQGIAKFSKVDSDTEFFEDKLT